MTQFREQLMQIWTRFLQEVSFITGLSLPQTQVLLWVMGGIFLLMAVLIPLHRWLKRKKI
ncbi:MAG: hypothetical protein Q4B28_05780 [bacterium]|nr:hypothetical protein [bacterium]